MSSSPQWPSNRDLQAADASRMNRRQALALGAGLATWGSLGVGWLDALRLQAAELKKQQISCVLLFLKGGPSQLETWDPKPGTGNGGPTRAIPTASAGVQIAEHWPQVAKLLNDCALLRTVSSKEGEHARATYQMHTGRRPTGGLKFPNLGSVVAHELGQQSAELPNFVSVGDTEGSGFLGVHAAPFIVGKPGQLPDNVALPVSDSRLTRRLELLQAQDADFAEVGASALSKEHQGLYAQAARLVQSPKLKAFDLDQEPAKSRDTYGNSSVGRGLLLARRLVEVGVPFIEVRHGNWDTHDDNFKRVKTMAGEVDPALASLLRDLKQRSLLQRTLVICMGEFGRTPKVNGKAGRDHWPRNFSVLVAGCGIQAGRVVGKTNKDGSDIADRPIAVPDLFSTFCKALRINPELELMTPLGRPIKIVDGGTPVKEVLT